MSRLMRFAIVLAFLMSALPARQALAAPTSSTCLPDGLQASGAIYRICMPEVWNGDLVLFAHGYTSPFEPLAIPDLSLPDGTDIVALVNDLGYAFATTSYSKNGLAIQQGIADLRDLTAIFKGMYPETKRVYLTGASEGGIITTLAIERYPSEFSGGLALCGPVGDFKAQVNYWGDFRTVYDYFFPGVLPPSPVDIPQEVVENWEGYYEPAVGASLAAGPHAAAQLLSVTGAPIDPADPATVFSTTTGILWYNVFATMDGIDTLGGQPFDNMTRSYRGSDDDRALNAGVERFVADPAALAEIAANYQTSGRVRIPLVTMHTTGDPIIPFWHELLYLAKIKLGHSLPFYLSIPIERYGHCSFTSQEVLTGFSLLVRKVTRQPLQAEFFEDGALLDLPELAVHQAYLPFVR